MGRQVKKERQPSIVAVHHSCVVFDVVSPFVFDLHVRTLLDPEDIGQTGT